MKRTLFNLPIFVFIALMISGCTPYKSSFKKWLGAQIAQSSSSLELNAVSVKRIQTSDEGILLQFEGTVKVTKDRYQTINDAIDMDAIRKARDRARDAGMDDSQVALLEESLLGDALNIAIVEKVMKRGERLSIKGKAIGMKNPSSGEWDFLMMEVEGGNLEGNELSSETSYEKGSGNAKKYIKETAQKIVEFVKAINEKVSALEQERAAKEALQAEEQKKEEERQAQEQKKHIEAVLATFAPGTVWTGTWKSRAARGKIGLQYTDNEHVPGKFILEGFIFDPDQPNNQKPFVGEIAKANNEAFPYKITLVSARNRGNVVIHFPNTKLGERPYSRTMKEVGIYDTINGLLYSAGAFELTIGLSQDMSQYVGRAKNIDGTYASFSSNPIDILMHRRDQQIQQGISQSTQQSIPLPPSSAAPQIVPQMQNAIPQNAAFSDNSQSKVTVAAIEQMLQTGQDITAVVQQLSNQATPLSNAAIAAIKSGNQQAANQILERLGSEFPAAPQSLFWMLSLAIQRGEHQSAQTIYTLLKRYPLDSSDRTQLEQMMK